MSRTTLRPLRLPGAVLALALVAPALALMVGSAPRAAADPTYLPAEKAIASTKTFNYVGGEETFVVPDGIYQIDVDAVGAPGGLSVGGRGAKVTATLTVEPGDVFYVRVGGGGGSGSAGWNGGGNPVAGSNGGAGGGGGATDLRTCGASETGCSQLGSRIVVAGGGGGAGGVSGGGENAAGDAGAAAPDYAGVRGPAGGGGAGTASAGGAGGVDASYANGGRGNGNAGTYGTGGSSRYTGTTFRGAGAGGGGLYGGGSGGTNQYYGAGGGGGSSLVPAGGTLTVVERTVGSHLSISYDAGPVTEVAVDVADDAMVATGADSTTVTATASLEDGTKVPGLEMVFESTDPGQSFGPVTDNGDGTYSSTLTGSTSAGDATVTATAKGSIRLYDVSGSADVTTEGYSLAVSPVTDTMVATGADSLTVSATAESASGTPLSDLPVTFQSSDAGQSFGTVTDHGDGTYSATLSGSATTGSATISASAIGDPTTTSATVETEGYTVTVEPVTTKLVATGLDSVPLTATAESASGELLPGLDVSFESTDDDQSFSAVTDGGDGTYSTTLSGSATAGPVTVTAAVSGAGDPTLVGASVETEGYTVTVEPVSTKLVATGLDSVPVTATAESASGELLPDLDVSFESSDAGQAFGAVTDEGDGTYSTTLSGSTTVGSATVTAAVTGAGDPTLVDAAVTTEGYTVTVQPVSTKLVATGLDSVPVTATARSASGQLLPDLDVSFASTDDGQSLGDISDEGDGTYSTTLSGSTTVGSATVTAAVSGAGDPTLVGASVTTEGYSVTVRPIDDPILGTGAAKLTVTAVARSASRAPMPGLTVSFVSTDPGQSFGAVTDHEDGTYSATLTGSTTPGFSGIRAVVTGAGTPSTPEIELVTDRYDKPSITASLSSTPSGTGWFRTPVTVTFACAGTLPLTAACPAPVVLSADGRDQVVARTVTDSFGSTGSVTSAAVSIDATAPRVTVTGARSGATYKKLRKLGCKGTDALSGVASCKITTTKKKVKKKAKKGTLVRWTATVVDRAGNTATSKGQYTIKKKVKKPKRR